MFENVRSLSQLGKSQNELSDFVFFALVQNFSEKEELKELLKN